MVKLFSSQTTLTFPYKTKTILNHHIPNPIITLPVLTSQFGYLDIRFLVDSGADFTLLPINPFADLLGITIDPDTAIKVAGIGRSIPAYPARLTLNLHNHQLPIRAYFAHTNTLPILGRLDLWKHYTITFNNQKQRTELVKI